MPQTKPLAGVATFDCELTAVLENDPVTGKDKTNAEIEFANPIASLNYNN